MTSAIEALLDLPVLKPQVLLTDLRLPGVDGFELIRRVRSDEKLSGMPIIVVSADTDPATPERIAALGHVPSPLEKDGQTPRSPEGPIAEARNAE